MSLARNSDGFTPLRGMEDTAPIPPISDDELSFQDIQHSKKQQQSQGQQQTKEEEPTGNEGQGNGFLSKSFLSIGYYQPWFDVSTQQIIGRLIRSMMPAFISFYTDADNRPDLYGPFWITTTLVVVISATANMANYLSSTPTAIWQSDFRKVSFAASLLYSWITIVPGIVWFLLRRIGDPKSYVELISLYGYSLTIFIPAAILSVIPSSFARWIVTFAALGLSTMFLMRNIWSTLPSEKKVRGYSLLILIGATHAALAFIFRLHFFN